MRAEAEEAAVGALLLASLEVDGAGEEQQLRIEQFAVGKRWRAVCWKGQERVVEQSALLVVQTCSEHMQPRGHIGGSATERRHELVGFKRADEKQTAVRLFLVLVAYIRSVAQRMTESSVARAETGRAIEDSSRRA